MDRNSQHVRSNVVGYVAVFIAHSGTAYAVDGPLAGQNTVGSEDIINAEVTNNDLALDSVGSGKIIDGMVKNADLSIGASSSNTIADGGIRAIDVRADTLTGAQVDESTLNAGGDVTGNVSNLQIGSGTIGLDQLRSGAGPGCCVGSDVEFSVPANGCTDKVYGPVDYADLGDIVIARPESADLGAGVFLRPTVVAHPGETVLEICNTTGSPVTIPFGTFFQYRVIGP